MNKERLLQLAEHLETGKLGHEVFDFNDWNAWKDNSEPLDLNVCGTHGCALGECPILWPEQWFFNKIGLPVSLNSRPIDYHNELSEPSRAAERWFDLNENEIDRLFVEGYSQEILDSMCDKELITKEMVARSIRKFVSDKNNSID